MKVKLPLLLTKRELWLVPKKLMVNPICSEPLELSSTRGSVLLSNPERIAFGPRAWAEYSVNIVKVSATAIAKTTACRLLKLIKVLIALLQ